MIRLSSYNIVVVGPSTLVGEALLNLLEERDFPVAQIYAASDEGGGRVTFRDKGVRVEALDSFDFAKAEIAFFCVDEEIAEQYVPRATAAGCVVIDDSPAFRLENDVPLVVPEVNPERLNDYRQQSIIANPSSCALMLATVLKPLQRAVGIDRVNVVTLQAASGKDRPGVEELAGQATAMFNMKPVEHKVFPAQIAFNLIPQIGSFFDDGSTREEMKLRWETQKLLDDDALKINATAVRVSVFHGHAMAVHIELAGELDSEAALLLLQAAPGIEVVDELEDGGYPTPAVDAVGQDTIFVGRIRKDTSNPLGLNLWVVADNIRKGAALNSIQIAEILIKEYLQQ
ncbi:MAG: aspartate-semialdehyde dehydrogenase [Pseudomonadota bacterium]|nr:aspartate-semialdehyde dehydrogenase [Pseudomonadota bacterium]